MSKRSKQSTRSKIKNFKKWANWKKRVTKTDYKMSDAIRGMRTNQHKSINK